SRAWRLPSELGTLHVVAEHLAHRAPDLALGRVVARAVEDLLHEVRLAGGLARRRGERLERGGAGLVVARPLDLGDRALLLLLDLVADVEDRDVELLVGLEVLVDAHDHALLALHLLLVLVGRAPDLALEEPALDARHDPAHRLDLAE